jgi:hypothetical protein
MAETRPITVLLVTAGLLVLGVPVGASPARADHVTYENATVTDTGFTVELPDEYDHYPGTDPDDRADVHFLPTMQPFENRTNSRGVEFHAGWLDFSDCHGIDNVTAYGIDRSASDAGTEYDERLDRYTKSVRFSADEVHLRFYELDDLAGDTPYVYPDDQLVFALADGSTGGACTSVTTDPGWYRLEFFANGAAHDDSEDLPGIHEIDHADRVAFTQRSAYVYVCECEDETEARQRLGPPPDRPDPTQTATPRPTHAATVTPTPDRPSTPTTTAEPSPTVTADATPPAERTPGGSATPDRTSRDSGRTPTEGDGVGFTPTIGLLALLAVASRIYRVR